MHQATYFLNFSPHVQRPKIHLDCSEYRYCAECIVEGWSYRPSKYHVLANEFPRDPLTVYGEESIDRA